MEFGNGVVVEREEESLPRMVEVGMRRLVLSDKGFLFGDDEDGDLLLSTLSASITLCFRTEF